MFPEIVRAETNEVTPIVHGIILSLFDELRIPLRQTAHFFVLLAKLGIFFALDESVPARPETLGLAAALGDLGHARRRGLLRDLCRVVEAAGGRVAARAATGGRRVFVPCSLVCGLSIYR